MTPMQPEAVPARTPGMVLPVLALIVALFFFCFDAGIFSMDHTKKIGNTFSIAAALAATWTFQRVRKVKAEKRSRLIIFAIIGGLSTPAIIGGFVMGKDEAYPAGSRALVHEIQEHARELKSVKAQLRQQRDSITKPEQLLSIQPLVTECEGHIGEIKKIDAQITHDTLPSVVAGILRLMNEALVYDQRQTKNLDEQLAVVKQGQGLNASKRAELFKARLEPLMEQELKIEKQRQDSNLEQRIMNMAAGKTEN